MNVSDLRKMLGLGDTSTAGPDDQDTTVAAAATDTTTTVDGGVSDSAPAEVSQQTAQLHSQPSIRSNGSTASSGRHFRVRRQSMEQLDLIKVF